MKRNNFFKELHWIFMLLGMIMLFLSFCTVLSIFISPTTLNFIIFSMIYFIDLIYIVLLKIIYFPTKFINRFLTLDQSECNLFPSKFYKLKIFNYFYTVYNKQNELNISKDKAELIRNQAEFHELQNQINPHFLYNTLESIRGEAVIKNVPEIAYMAKTLASFFRYSISSSQNLVYLHEELNNIKNYFSIQQYRFGNKLLLKIIIKDDDVSLLDNLIPKLTLQPIIENSIFHGLETRLEKGYIHIKITSTQSRLLITVSDNGIGIEQDRLNQINNRMNHCFDSIDQNDLSAHSGIALLNVNKRIKLCFGQNYGISLRSIPNFGTDVEIVLPLIRR